MKWRMLEYMSRIADAEPELDLFSVVFYVGQGAGATDTGEYQVNAPDGTVSIKWKYKVVRIWKMPAQDLLALQRPGLLPLIGQTQLDDPQTMIPQVVDGLNQIEDEGLRQRLFTSLLALVEDKEIATMVEKLIEQEGLLMDTPFLRRIRAESRQQARRETILEVLTLRFDPAISIYRELENYIAKINDDMALEQLLAAAVKAETLVDFRETLRKAITPVQQGLA